jgi:hypothetical protein
MYLYSKKPHLKGEVRVQNNLGWYERSYNAYLSRKVPHLQVITKSRNKAINVTVEVSGYDVIEWIFGTKNKWKLICHSPNDIISANYDGEKVDQDGIFYYKDILHFVFGWPKRIPKIVFVLSRTSKKKIQRDTVL